MPIRGNVGTTPGTFAAGDRAGESTTIDTARSGDVTLIAGEFARCSTASANHTATLPTAPPDGTTCGIYLERATIPYTNSLTINPGGSDVIEAINGTGAIALYKPNTGVVLRYCAASVGGARWIPTSSIGLYPDTTFATTTVLGFGTATGTNVLLVSATTAGLPDATAAIGRRLTIKKTSSAATTLTISVLTGGQTIDGASTYVMTTQYDSADFVSDGANWWVV